MSSITKTQKKGKSKSRSRSRSRSRSKSSTSSASASSVLRVSPETKREVKKYLNKTTMLKREDIKKVVHDLVHTRTEFEVLRLRYNESNIDNDATKVLLNFLRKKTPTEYRSTLVENEFMDTIIDKGTDKELMLWIVKEIVEPLLHGIRDNYLSNCKREEILPRIINKKVMERYMKSEPFAQILNE